MARNRLLYDSEINVICSEVKIFYLNLGELFGGVNLGGMEKGGFQGAVLGKGNETKGELEELKGNVDEDEKREKKTCLKVLTTETWSFRNRLNSDSLVLLHNGRKE
jgi:hypothetical protein